MPNARLKVIATEETSSPPPLASYNSRKIALEAKFERLWLQNPEQFNPLRNCMQRERIERTWHLLCSHVDLANKKTVDLGCGSGLFSIRLRNAGAIVDSVDIAKNALEILRQSNCQGLTLIQDALPLTSLDDSQYTLVICMEVIAELPQADHRLLISELNRLIKPTGKVLFSTGIDIYSVGGLEKLLALLQTEFDLSASLYSYHRAYIKFLAFLEFPRKIVSIGNDPVARKEALAARKGLNKLWVRINSYYPINWLWKPLEWLLNPLIKIYKQNRRMLLTMEKISFFWNPDEPSHAAFILKRRPIDFVNEKDAPVERQHKREVWE